MTNFFLLGNGGGGTSLLRGLLNAHSKIDCMFENKGSTKAGDVEGSMQKWNVLIANSHPQIWGNKMPVEQFVTRGWNTNMVVDLIDDFKIIWLVRRFSKYHKKGRASPDLYRRNWDWANEIYWLMREKRPRRVIRVSFEDLLLRTVIELRRICVFLGIRYEPTMLKGTRDTGLGRYDQAIINKEKV